MGFETPKAYREVSHEEVRAMIEKLKSYEARVDAALSHQENIGEISWKSLQDLANEFSEVFENLKMKSQEVSFISDEAVTPELSEEARRLSADVSTLSMFAKKLVKKADELNGYYKTQFPDKVPFDIVRANLLFRSKDNDPEIWKLLGQISAQYPKPIDTSESRLPSSESLWGKLY